MFVVNKINTTEIDGLSRCHDTSALVGEADEGGAVAKLAKPDQDEADYVKIRRGNMV